MLGAAALGGVVEPAGAEREVGLPLAEVPVEDGAAHRIHVATLVAGPAVFGAELAAEDGYLGLQFAHEAQDLAEAVVAFGNLPRLLGAAVPAVAAVGAVEPHLEDLAVPAVQQLAHLGVVDLDVFFGRVVGAVAVPRRAVDAELQPGAAAGVAHLAHVVALSAAERRLGDVVLSRLGGPEAEAVVVLGDHHQPADAAVPARADDLVGVEARGGEHRGVLVAVAPFAVGEGVESPVDDADDVLLGVEADAVRGAWLGRGGGGQRAKRRGNYGYSLHIGGYYSKSDGHAA